MTIAVSPPVPDTIRPPEVDLAVTAILLRAGIYGEAVPAYSEPALIRALTRISHAMTWPRTRRSA